MLSRVASAGVTTVRHVVLLLQAVGCRDQCGQSLTTELTGQSPSALASHSWTLPFPPIVVLWQPPVYVPLREGPLQPDSRKTATIMLAILQPSSKSISVKCEPINPSAPVTNTFFGPIILFLFSISVRHCHSDRT